jgi:hypothetical protein
MFGWKAIRLFFLAICIALYVVKIDASDSEDTSEEPSAKLLLYKVKFLISRPWQILQHNQYLL